jgi:hypothetical protein
MRWLVGWQTLVFAIAVFTGGLFLGSRLQTADPVHSSAAERLQPAATVSTALTPGATVYVPVYSSRISASTSQRMVSWGHDRPQRQRGTSDRPQWARYYDSEGKLVQTMSRTVSAAPLGRSNS